MQIINLQWQDTLAIRQEVLWPDKSQDFCRVEGDEDALHFGVILDYDSLADKKLICVASIYPDPIHVNNTDTRKNNNNHKGAHLRKFATLVSYQKRGIGSLVIRHIIDQLKAQNSTYLRCDTRESALAFYQRFGFTVEGSRFYKGDIPYFKMQLRIT
ncbi:MAG: ribosomal protein S18 acetylase RimI-like enzyme [Cocleimonas sp.]|jgi:ribosomal protein S18 acetylase RimI-like enzyme